MHLQFRCASQPSHQLRRFCRASSTQKSRSRITFVIFPATPRPNLPPFTLFPCLRWGGNRKWPEKSAFRGACPRRFPPLSNPSIFTFPNPGVECQALETSGAEPLGVTAQLTRRCGRPVHMVPVDSTLTVSLRPYHKGPTLVLHIIQVQAILKLE